MRLKIIALTISILVALIVLPPAYFLGNNVAHAAQQPPDLTTFPTDGEGGGGGGAIQSPDGAPLTGGSQDQPFTVGAPVHTNTPSSTSLSRDQQDLRNLAVASTGAALMSAFAFTLPGTTQVGDWTDPRSKTPPPLPANPLLCSKPSNYTLSASLNSENAVSIDSDKPLFESTEKITVFGDVFSKSAKCSGMTLDCSEQVIQGCNVNRLFMGYELKYQPCTGGFTDVHHEGARKQRSTFGIVMLVASIALSVISMGAGAPLTAALGSTAVKAVATVGALAASTGSQIAAQNIQNSVNDNPCFNVCAKKYTTEDPSHPFCNKGGPVISFTKTEYDCSESSCGPAKQKSVSIDVKTSEGSRVKRADTKTDSTGHFSFTFDAPGNDGDYLVFVKVPKQ